MIETSRLDDDCAEQAISWMVEYKSGEMDEGQMRALEQWLESDPAHARAWQKLQTGLSPFDVVARQELPSRMFSNAVLRQKQTRRNVVRGFLIAGMAGGAAALTADRFSPINLLLSDHVTGTGEHERVKLANGADVTLAARTAIDDPTSTKALQLISGQIYARFPQRDRPYTVEAGDVFLATKGGGAVVSRRDDQVTVIGVHGTAQVSKGGGKQDDVKSGDKVVYSGSEQFRERVDIEDAMAWTRKILIVDDKTVAEIVDGIRPYFSGVIRVVPEVASMRASGVFRLSDPVSALSTLAVSLNLKVRSIAGIWMTLDR